MCEFKRVLAGVLGAFAVFALSSPSAHCDPAASPQNAGSCGFLLIAQGTVEILRQHPTNDADSVRHYMPGQKSTPLSCDDVVVTRQASNATIQVSRGKITIGPNSRVEIAKFSGAADKPEVNVIDLVYGKVRALVTKKPESGDKAYFRIKTPVAVIGVRGTDFFVGHNPNTKLTEQATLVGSVEVKQENSLQKVLVKSGQQTSVGTEAHKAKLVIKPITEQVKQEIRVTSAMAKADAEFTQPDAVKILGDPKQWNVEREEVPSKFKDLKDEY